MTDDKITNETMVNNIEIIVNGVNHAKSGNGKQQNEKDVNTKPTLNKAAFLCLLNVSFGLFESGMFVGWTSYATDYFQEQFTENQIFRLYTSLALSAAIIPLLVHRMWHRIGTKRFIIIAEVFIIISWTLIIWSNKYWILVVSRCFGGMAAGILHFTVPLYINDVISVDHKPLCHSIMQFQFVLGVLVQHILRIPNTFLIIHLVPVAISLIHCITILFVPESLRYLTLQKKSHEVQTILSAFHRNCNDVENDLAIWTQQPHQISFAFKADLSYVIPVFGLCIFEQMTGAVPMLFYFRQIFALIDGEFAPATMAILCVGVFAASTLSSHYRNVTMASIKSSLIFSTNLMAIILGALGTYCHFQGSFAINYTEDYRHIPFICLLLFYIVFAFGAFRLTSEYVDHIIPKQVYFSVRCLLTTASWFLIYVITSILPELIRDIGVGWLFWFMAMMCVTMVFFVRSCVPMPMQRECQFV